MLIYEEGREKPRVDAQTVLNNAELCPLLNVLMTKKGYNEPCLSFTYQL